jgi:hypothetical protein
MEFATAAVLFAVVGSGIAIALMTSEGDRSGRITFGRMCRGCIYLGDPEDELSIEEQIPLDSGLPETTGRARAAADDILSDPKYQRGGFYSIEPDYPPKARGGSLCGKCERCARCDAAL